MIGCNLKMLWRAGARFEQELVVEFVRPRGPVTARRRFVRGLRGTRRDVAETGDPG
jgi:hypothetical protein